MARQSDLTDFMMKKAKESRGESVDTLKDEEEGLKEAPKTIHKEAGVDDSRATKALTTFRYIMRMLFVIPLVVAMVVLIGYILMIILPAALFFIKKLIVSIASLQ